MTPIDLTGRVALVTGGSRGIGHAIATALHGAGAKVALCGRDGAKAQAVAAALGGAARGYACDLGDAAQIERLAETVESEVGPVDVLVNNAAITRDNLLFRIGADDWDAVLSANLKGPFLLTKLVARGMIKRRWGRVVNIASVVGLIGNKGQANYAAAKAGLIGFTKAVAKELASRNVLVNAVAPGYIETAMTGEMTDEAKKALVGQIVLGRLGTGADVAGAVLWLASEDAAYVTGTCVNVSGGLYIG